MLTYGKVSNTYFLVPRQRVHKFFGREVELEKISAFFNCEVKEPRILILNALGGQGKSQIALEYCQRSRVAYQGIFWINSTSKSTTTQSLVSVARELDDSAVEALDDDNAKVKFALHTLEQWHDRWLLVFDNYDDPITFSDIKQYTPRGISLTEVMSQDANFLSRQRRHPHHQSPSRSGGTRKHRRNPAHAGQGGRSASPTSIPWNQCRRSYVRRL